MRAEREAARYGDRHAPVYERIYGARFVPDAAVAVLAGAAAGGRVLELGVGTGRLAVPLAARGVPVDGIEASTAMIARLRDQPGGDRVGVFEVDLDGFDLPRHEYAVAVCAVSTLFMLPSPAAQARCVTAAAPASAAGRPALHRGVPSRPVPVRRSRPARRNAL